MRLVWVVPVAWMLCACGGAESSPARDGGRAGAASDAGTDAGTPGDSEAGRSGSGAAGASGNAGSAGKGAQAGAGAGAGRGGGAGTSEAGAPARVCLPAGAYCTWSNAEDCCSGHCDGDSCCGYLGDACQNGFGCCAGSCIDGVCQCPPGTLDCGAGCVDIQWNENRCGDCDTQCGQNALCDNGQCACDPNLFDAQFYELCPGGCFNTRQDAEHCGDCTTACTGGTECAGGSCECPYATLDCGGGCEDITANVQHCGACDSPCEVTTEDCVNRQCQCKAGLFACTTGVCVDRQTDESHCGTCGHACTGNKTCQAGVCAN